MKYCGNCGNKVDDNAYICPKCGVIVNNNNSFTNVVDKGGIGWGILGFFVPVAGLIIYLTMKENKPKTAKSAGKGALISLIVNIIVYVLVMIIFGIVFTILGTEF